MNDHETHSLSDGNRVDCERSLLSSKISGDERKNSEIAYTSGEARSAGARTTFSSRLCPSYISLTRVRSLSVSCSSPRKLEQKRDRSQSAMVDSMVVILPTRRAIRSHLGVTRKKKLVAKTSWFPRRQKLLVLRL